jgi:hypothetical protein
MADDAVTVGSDGQGSLRTIGDKAQYGLADDREKPSQGTDGASSLLGLEPATTENAGLISPMDENSNPQALGNPLLGTSTSQVLEISRGSSKNGPQRACATICCYDLVRVSSRESRGNQP